MEHTPVRDDGPCARPEGGTMATGRKGSRLAVQEGPPAAKADRRGQCKVTMWLPRDLARRLRIFAVASGVDLGHVCAPAIERAIAGSYWVSGRSGPRPGLVELA